MANLLITGAYHEDRLAYAKNLSLQLCCLEPKNTQHCGECNNCQRISAGLHPNISYIEPPLVEKDAVDDSTKAGIYQTEIKIDQIRRLIEENYKRNWEMGPAIFIITHMHFISKAAANALLKSIEESGENKVFLALAPSRSAVLPTIASRLLNVLVQPRPLPILAPEQHVQKIYAITSEKPSNRFKLSQQFAVSRNELLEELEDLEQTCHVLMRAHCSQRSGPTLAPEIGEKISHAISKARALLERNVNPRLLTEDMLFHEWPYACLSS